MRKIWVLIFVLIMPILARGATILKGTLACDYTITAATSMPYDGGPSGSNVKPGETICINSTRTTSVNIRNLAGTAAKPITITNSGQVNLTSGAGAATFKLDNCHDVKVLGNGAGYTNTITSNHPLHDTWAAGLKFSATAGENVVIDETTGSCDNIEMGYIEVDRSSAIAVSWVDSGPSPPAQNFYMHHFKISNAETESISIGSGSGCANQSFDGMKIEYGIFDTAYYDHIQINCVTSGDFIIRYNYIANAGTDENGDCSSEDGCTKAGIVLLSENDRRAEIYGNWIYRDRRFGIYTINGEAANPDKIWGNLISESGYGIADADCDDSANKKNSDGINISNSAGAIIYNNTVYANCDGIVEATDNYNSIIKNNISYSTYVSGASPNQVALRVLGDGKPDAIIGTNIWYSSGGYHDNINDQAGDIYEDPLFMDVAKDDYSLSAGSPAINAGLTIGESFDDAFMPNSSSLGDQDSYGSAWEIGAFIHIPYSVKPFLKLFRNEASLLSSAQQALIADYFDMIVIADANYNARKATALTNHRTFSANLKAKNSNVKILWALDARHTFDRANYWAYDECENDEALFEHDYTSPCTDGCRVYQAAVRNWYLMDITNSDWTMKIITWYLTDLKDNNTDGLYLDNGKHSIAMGAESTQYICDSSPPCDSTTEYCTTSNPWCNYTNSNTYAADMNDHLETIKTALASATVIYNGLGDSYDYTNAQIAGYYADSLEGGLIEGFVFSPRQPTFDQVYVKTDIDDLIKAIDDGYIAVASPKSNTTLTDYQRRVAFAGFLLGNDSVLAFYRIQQKSDGAEHGNLDWFPEFFLDIGIPLGSPTRLSELIVGGKTEMYERSYSKGLVVMNLDSSSQSYTTSSVYYSLTLNGGGIVKADGLTSGCFNATLLPAGTHTIPAKDVLILSDTIPNDAYLCHGG